MLMYAAAHKKILLPSSDKIRPYRSIGEGWQSAVTKVTARPSLERVSEDGLLSSTGKSYSVKTSAEAGVEVSGGSLRSTAPGSQRLHLILH